MNTRTAKIFRRILEARAKRRGVTVDEVSKSTGKPLYFVAAEQEAKRRGITASQVLNEDCERLQNSIQCWQADSAKPEEGYSPVIPLPFYVRHWIFWERPGCYPCRKKFATQELYEGHYIENHMGVER